MRRALGLLCFFVFSVVSSRQGAAADPEDLIRRGVELRRQEKDAEALSLFQQAYDLSKAAKALAQIGLAEQALGKWGAADRHLRTALQTSDDSWVLKHRKTIEDAMAAIGQHVGRLEVRGGPIGAQVRVDGELIGKLPLVAPFAVSAGGVAVEVRAEGYVPILRGTSVPIGQLIRETFELQLLPPPIATPTVVAPPATASSSPYAGASRISDDRLQAPGDSPPAQPAASDPSEPSGSARPFIALGLVALAAGAGAVGVIEHVTWQNKTHEFSSTTGCDPSAPYHGSTACNRLWADVVNARLGAYIGYGVGAGLLATAAILYLTTPSGGSNPRRLACVVNPLVAGAGCALRF